MRTTLVIDDDVLVAARTIARQRRESLGHVISELARMSLPRTSPMERNDIPLLPISNPDAVITLEIVNELRDEYP